MTLQPKVVIRDAKDSEKEQLWAVLLEAYRQYADVIPDKWEAYRQNIYDSVYQDGALVRIVAEIDGQIIGSALLYDSADSAYGNPDIVIPSPVMRLLAVSPRVRGKGIAALLVKEIIERARSLGADSLHLHTSDMMAAAIKLYERLGFQRAYETDTHNGSTLVKGYRIEIKRADYPLEA
ncbi:GNAT family N-acetyltransferase [Paenibacillus naphthalenovorans]|uniref:GCN5 family acetyltransferase n=1 Tax=Paenibacillus naphthalenovorans TaxID=162209 RepID=A0A0U2W179_9BACL|nr:GNAT family N-acetyltransferase [Paenibacillus naphthalenovorans]ALS21133.1 GCN5 family acetyltransferase [Paenibacillus naphthalenovorans]